MTPSLAQRSARACIVVLYAAALWMAYSAWKNPATRIWFEPQGLEQLGRQLQSSPLGPLAVVAGYVLAVLMAVPIWVLIIAGVLVFGPWPGMIYAWVGMVSGATVAYGLGRWLGGSLLERLTARSLPALRAALKRYGMGAVLFVRLVPIAPFMVGNLTFGALKVPVRTYVVGTALGLLPGTLLTGLFLERLTAAWQDPTLLTWLLLAGVVVAIGMTVWFVRRRMREAPVREVETAVAPAPDVHVQAQAHLQVHAAPVSERRNVR